MKRACKYCGRKFKPAGIGPHQAHCPERPGKVPVKAVDYVVDEPVVTDNDTTRIINYVWSTLTPEEKKTIILRFFEEKAGN